MARKDKRKQKPNGFLVLIRKYVRFFDDFLTAAYSRLRLIAIAITLIVLVVFIALLLLPSKSEFIKFFDDFSKTFSEGAANRGETLFGFSFPWPVWVDYCLIAILLLSLFDLVIFDLIVLLFRKLINVIKRISSSSETLHIRRTITKSRKEAHILAPIDDAYDRKKYNLGSFAVYEEKLNDAFANKNVSNIALIGGYGVGKSSIIRSHEKLDVKKGRGYLYISLMDYNHEPDYNGSSESEDKKTQPREGDTGFQTETENDYTAIADPGINEASKVGDAAKSTNKVEKYNLFENYLLGFILSRANEVRLPDSGYKLIPKSSRIRELPIFIAMVFFIFSAFGLLFYSDFSVAGSFLGISGFEKYYLIICLMISIFLLLIYLKRKLTIKSLTLKKGDVEALIEAQNKVEKGYVDSKLFEMMYALENIAPQIGHTVVFEDMDRLDTEICVAIFQKLCRLSKMINNRNQGRYIRFVYSFNDSIFSAIKRNKYFDYILEVHPLLTREDAGEYFRNCLLKLYRDDKGLLLGQISFATEARFSSEDYPTVYSNIKVREVLSDPRMEKAWRLIGNCIYDIRTINCIVDGYEVFVDMMLFNNRIPNERWLPFVLYKNLLPTDYHNSFSGDTLLSIESRFERDCRIREELTGSEEYKESVCRLIHYFLSCGLLKDNDTLSFVDARGGLSLSETSADRVAALKHYAMQINVLNPKGRDEVTKVLYSIAEHYEKQFDYNTALKYTLRAGDMQNYKMDDYYKGRAYEKAGNYDQAAHYYTKGIHFADWNESISCQNGLKRVLALQNRDYNASLTTELSNELFKPIDPARVRHDVIFDQRSVDGYIAEKAEQYLSALEDYQKNRDDNSSTIIEFASACADIGMVEELRKNHKDSVASFSSAITICIAELDNSFPNTSVVYKVFANPCLGQSAICRAEKKCQVARLAFDSYVIEGEPKQNNRKVQRIADISFILGIITSDMARIAKAAGDASEFFQLSTSAIGYFNNATDLYTECGMDSSPYYALVSFFEAELCSERWVYEHNDFNHALHCYETALDLFTYDIHYSSHRAITSQKIGVTYFRSAFGEKAPEYLPKAKSFLAQAYNYQVNTYGRRNAETVMIRRLLMNIYNRDFGTKVSKLGFDEWLNGQNQ